MKDVVFWAADAWNAVTVSCFRKVWCPLLDISYKDKPIEKDHPKLEKFLKKIPGSSDLTSDDIQKWVTEDEPELIMSDKEMVTPLLSQKNSSLEDLQEESELKISPDQARIQLYKYCWTSLKGS